MLFCSTVLRGHFSALLLHIVSDVLIECTVGETKMYCILLLVSVATQYAPAHCTRGRCCPDAATQLQPIPYACGAQRALLPIAVGAMNNNELMNTNNVRESVTIFPRPCKLRCESHTVTRANSVSIFVFLGLCSRVIPDVRDIRQTSGVRQMSDRRQTKASLNDPA